MKQKDILFILMPISIFVVAWIVFSIYHNSATSTISGTLSTNILPIAPNFDIKTVLELKKREKVAPLFQIPTPENLTPTPNPNPTPTSIPIPSPTLSQPTATPEPSITP